MRNREKALSDAIREIVRTDPLQAKKIESCVERLHSARIAASRCDDGRVMRDLDRVSKITG